MNFNKKSFTDSFTVVCKPIYTTLTLKYKHVDA